MLEDCQYYTHYDEAAATQQSPVHSAGACADMGWPSMSHNSTGTAPCCSQQLLLQQHLKQHQHHQQHRMTLSSSFSAPSALQLEHTQQLSVGLVQPTHHLPPDLSTLLLCQQQQHQPQQQQSHTTLSLTRVSSSTADANSEGPGGSIPSSESTASQSPSMQLSTAQHNLRTSVQRRATAARPPQQPGSNSAAGPAAALHGVQASNLKKGHRSSTSVLFGGSRVNSTGCPSSTTSSSEALKELLRQAIARKQQQQQQASGSGDAAAVRQRLLAALAAAQQRASTPQPQQPQQPGTRTAVETASQLLELVADQVSPVVASGMRQRLLQELRAISEDAAAAGVVFDVEAETRHVLPQLQAAAATAIRMQQAAAASAAALGGLTPSFGAQLQLPTTNAGATAAGTGVLAAAAAADGTDTPSGAQLAALLESTLSAAAASPAAVARSQGGSPACSGDAPSANPTLRPNPAASASLLTTVAGQAGQGSAGGRAASPEAGSMQQLSLQDCGDLDADQARGSTKRPRVAAAARGGSGPKGSSAQPAPPSSSSWRQGSPAPQAHLGSCASLAGVQDAGAAGPAAAAAAAAAGGFSFDLEHLLQAELEAAMLEELGG